MFPADFDKFVRGFVYPHENVYAHGHYGDLNYVVTENVANDNGGLTKFGIDAESHPNIDIANLNPDSAELVYWQDFYKSDSVMLPGRLALYHFDEVVNAGVGAENHILQEALGIVQDGVLGPQTLLAAYNAWQSDPTALVKELLDSRQAYYVQLAKNPKLTGFEPGWLNRVADLRTFAF